MKVYLVGGAIRNKLLKLPVIDKDWVVVGSTPKELLQRKYKQVGKDFPVFLHPKTYEEYALARKERKFGKGYKGFNIDYRSNISLREDLIRRDLTINAIAQDNYGKYIDPFNGLKDIKLRILKHISPAFSEDPLRVLRVARFAAAFFHLGFKIAKKTMKLMNNIVKSKELLYLDVQRVWKETEKAMKTDHPHIFFQVLNCCKALAVLFPEIIKLVSIHKNLYLLCTTDNVYERCFKSLAKISIFSKEIDIKFAYLCQCLSFRNFNFYANKEELLFNKLFVIIILNFFSRLKIPIMVSNLSSLIIKNQYFLYNIYSQSSESIIHLFYQINAWRNPTIVDKLSFLIDFDIVHFRIFLHKNKMFLPGQYLKKMFLVANQVTFKAIKHKKMVGIAIAEEFKRLRIVKINNWRKIVNV